MSEMHQRNALLEEDNERLRANYARLQEQVEMLTKERDGLIKAVADHVTVRGEYFARAEVAEAERDRLREENDRLKRGLMGMAMFAKPAALKKEPQP